MNIKAAYRYQLDDNKASTLIYYLIMASIFVLLYSTMAVSITTSDGGVTTGQFSGMEMATAIFALVAGLNSFKEVFRMFLQNGISRKTLFISRCYTVITFAAIMAVADKVLYIIFKGLSEATDGSLKFFSLFELIYLDKPAKIGDIGFHVISLLFHFTLYLAFMATGYLIRLIEYRLNRLGRLALNVTVPVFVLIVLPALDSGVTNGRISTAISDSIKFAYGVSNDNPFIGVLTQILIFVVFSFFSWLLIRRANMKDTE